MAIKKVAPYGEWESPITIEDATAGSKAVSSPRGDIRTGRAFFLEATPSGASTIVEAVLNPTGTTLRHVLPAPHGVGTAVHEYGGGAYEIIPSSSDDDDPTSHQQRIIFSDAGAGHNALKLLAVDRGEVTTLVGAKPWLRYADFGVGPPACAWVLAIEEDHAEPEPARVRNYVVAVHLTTGRVQRLVEGADFYTTPRFSPDGKWVVWRTWNHPDMCWTKSELRWARVLDAGDDEGLVLGASELVAGGQPGEAVGEFAWGPDGVLYFTHEVEGDDWRQMFTVKPGEKAEKLKLKGLEEVEMGSCSMGLDYRTFAFLSKTSMVLTYDKFATRATVHVDLPTLTVTPLTIPLLDMRDALAALTPTTLLMAGAGAKQPQGIYHIALSPTALAHPTITQVQTSATTSYPPTLFTTPEHIHFTSRRAPHRPIHAFFFPPHNPNFTAPPTTLPPLILSPHGGPTTELGAGLALTGLPGATIPLYTTRGFAYLAVNYTGSTGHGRAYRDRLASQWGILDRDDMRECAEHICHTLGRADAARVGIHGGSAGGFNVLQSLVWHPDVFAAGASYCGVSDTAALAHGTHKLESHYLEGLLYAEGMGDAERAVVDAERSPLRHAERIVAPLLLLHGDEDTVVPIAQSWEMERRVREAGGVVKMVVARGDGHMFGLQANRRLALENDLAWFVKYLVRKEDCTDVK